MNGYEPTSVIGERRELPRIDGGVVRGSVSVMAEPITVHLTGVNPSTVHLHIHTSSDNEVKLARLTSMENTMSELSNAVTALIDRINTDVV